MKILIVSATTLEVEHLFKQNNISVSDKKKYSTKINSHFVDVIITGVGMTATTYHTTKALLSDKYDLAINAGICGSFNKNLEIGTVVNIYQDCFSELGAEDDETFLTLDELKLPGKSTFINTTKVENEVLEEIPKVTGITVNTTHGNETSINKIFERFHPYVESMEGAAFMMVCEEEKIPYLQLRAVSNYVEKRNRNNWNIPLAIEYLNKNILSVLQSL